MRNAMLTTAAVAIVAAAGCRGEELAGPGCADPAPLHGAYDARAPGYFVVLREGVEPSAEAARLGAHYGFAPEHLADAAFRVFFVTDLAAGAVAGLRCERTVEAVEHNHLLSPRGGAEP